MEINDFAKKKPYLFWYISDFDKLSEEAIVESILNYGNWQDIEELIKILGIQKVSSIFREKARMRRNNFRPEIKNYFELYFNKHA